MNSPPADKPVFTFEIDAENRLTAKGQRAWRTSLSAAWTFLCGLVVATGAKQAISEYKDKQAHEVHLSSTYAESGDGTATELSPKIVLSDAKDVAGFGILQRGVMAFVFVSRTWGFLNRAFSTGHLGVIRQNLIRIALGIILYCLLFFYAQRQLDLQRVQETEKGKCHVCLDSSVIASPPCANATFADFTEYGSKMKLLTNAMEGHLTRNKHHCITSFHVGSNVCAYTMTGMFGAYTRFNPVVIGCKWDNPPRKWAETSDRFPGITREITRPSEVTVRYTDYDPATGNLTTKEDFFIEGDAACICNVIDELTGNDEKIFGQDTTPPPIAKKSSEKVVTQG